LLAVTLTLNCNCLITYICTNLQSGAPPAAVLKTLAVRRESRAAALQANSDSNSVSSSSARRGSKEWQLQQQLTSATADDQVSEISIVSEPLMPGTGGARRVTATAAAAVPAAAAAAVYDATDEGRKAAQGNKTAATAFDGTVLAAAQGA
jgi:hypothetical protein